MEFFLGTTLGELCLWMWPNSSFLFLIVLVCLCTAGKKHLEKAVEHCLALLNLTLQKENLFMDLLRESHLSLIVTPLEQLLQGINPRTKKADHVVNIARYVQSTEKGGVLEAWKPLDSYPFILPASVSSQDWNLPLYFFFLFFFLIISFSLSYMQWFPGVWFSIWHILCMDVMEWETTKSFLLLLTIYMFYRIVH